MSHRLPLLLAVTASLLLFIVCASHQAPQIAASRDIWLCLLLSGLLGGLVGWLLRIQFDHGELDRQATAGQERVDFLYEDLGSTQDRLNRVTDQLRSQQAELETGRLEIAQREARIRSLQATVQAFGEEIEQKNSESLELAVELDESRRDLLVRNSRIAVLEAKLAERVARAGR